MLNARAKSTFFDRKAVLDAFGKAGEKSRQALSKAGAFIRQRARSSMRRRKKSAAQGLPPSAHEGSLKEKLYFAYDPVAHSVVVGPVPYRRGLAPNLLEFGGQTTVKARGGKSRTVTYRGNPYMAPALEAERPNLPKQWAESVKA